MKRRGEYLKENPDSRFMGTADPKRYMRYLRWFRQWKMHCDYLMQYNEMVEDKLTVIFEMIDTLGLIGEVDPEKVLEELESIKPTDEYDPETMYHPNHITQ